MNPTNGSPSSIDLTLCDPSRFMEYTWSTYDNVCGSDHYPIIIQNNIITHIYTPRWNTNKANWEKFCQLCSIQLIKGKIHTIEKFTKTLITIAEACIPKTLSLTKKNKPWFNTECKKAIQQRKAALRKFKKEPTTKNCIEYKQKRAKAHKTINETKKTCWQEYISKINTYTKPKTIWKMIRKISRKHNPLPIKHHIPKNSKITEKKVIANKLAEIFSDNSSSKHYCKQFQSIKKKTKKNTK